MKIAGLSEKQFRHLKHCNQAAGVQLNVLFGLSSDANNSNPNLFVDMIFY
jgi:hypothetical protein